jgi:hypothetical protein
VVIINTHVAKPENSTAPIPRHDPHLLPNTYEFSSSIRSILMLSSHLLDLPSCHSPRGRAQNTVIDSPPTSSNMPRQSQPKIQGPHKLLDDFVRSYFGLEMCHDIKIRVKYNTVNVHLERP